VETSSSAPHGTLAPQLIQCKLSSGQPVLKFLRYASMCLAFQPSSRFLAPGSCVEVMLGSLVMEKKWKKNV